MKILIACEESQRICAEFRKMGHESYSCDIQEPSGGHLEWHILSDVLPLINGNCAFQTMEGGEHWINGCWDLIVAHPPCTYLSNVATRHHSLRGASLSSINNRTWNRIRAMEFFMKIICADCDKIAVENPIGVMNTCYRSPDQIIHPYMFADSPEDTENYVTKATCLWLKGLPVLMTNNLPKPDNKQLFGVYANGKARTWEEMVSADRQKNRSKTFPAIAKAIAEQWGIY